MKISNLKIPISMPSSIKSFSIFFLLCMFTLGIDLLFFDPRWINPDSYYYISIANYYLYAPSPDFRDAYTVGPVIPALLFLLKRVTIFFFGDVSIDVKLLKLITFLVYVLISCLIYRYLRKDLSKLKSFVFIFLLFGTLSIQTDSMSLNGELVGVLLLLLIMNITPSVHENLVKLFIISFISVVALYTKIQLIPLILLVLASQVQIMRDRFWVAFFVVITFSSVEFLLFQNGIGIFRGMFKLIDYVKQGSPRIADGGFDILFIISGHLNHLEWCVRNLLGFIPIIGYIFFSLLYAKNKTHDSIFSSWVLWLVVTILAIYIPHRPFPHYFLLAIPFCVKFFPQLKLIKADKNLNYFFLLCVFLVFSSKLIISYRNFVNLHPGYLNSLLNTPSTPELDDIKEIHDKNLGTVYVHGWNYQINSLLNSYSEKPDLYEVYLGSVDDRTYINNLTKRKYDYLLDIVNYSGLITDYKYSFSANNLFSSIVSRDYNLVYSRSNLNLYKRKDESKVYGELKPKVIDSWKIKKSVNSCNLCFPAVKQLSKVLSNSISGIGTYSDGGDSAIGSFVVSYIPTGILNEVKFITGPNTSGLDIKIKRLCDDEKVKTTSISLKQFPHDQEAIFFINNQECTAKYIDIQFTDSGEGYGQWIGFLGLYKYQFE